MNTTNKVQKEQLLYEETTPSLATFEVQEVGNVRVNNFSINFDTTYPQQLRDVITEEEYKKEIKLINKHFATLVPQTNKMLLGFVCCPISLGMSLIPTIYSLTSFEKKAKKYLTSVNTKYSNRHITWDLKKTKRFDEYGIEFVTSCIEIEYRFKNV